MSIRPRQIGEFELIDRLVARFPPSTVSIGPGDDAAVIDVSHPLVVTTDTLVEGRHFRRSSFAAEDVGWKSLAVNLSDLAAMGATPRWFLSSLSLPDDWDLDWIERFAAGLSDCAQAYRIELVGGNVTGGASALSVTVTALGELDHGPAWRRSGARPGDAIGVFGELGWAAAGQRALEPSLADSAGVVAVGREAPFDAKPETAQSADTDPFGGFKRAQRRPIPQCGLRELLEAASVNPSAAIDVSDGLLQDLGHLLLASGVGARIELAPLRPTSALLRFASATGFDPWPAILGGGEDYAMLITAESELDLPGARWIGRCVEDPNVLELSLEGKPFPLPAVRGFQHTSPSEAGRKKR